MSATYNPETGWITLGDGSKISDEQRAVGTYMGKINGVDDGQDIKVQPLGSEYPIWIRTSTSSNTAGASFRVQYAEETSLGTTTGAQPMFRGPMATYTTTANTPGISWFVDRTLDSGNVAYCWDRTMHVNYNTETGKAEIVDQKNLEKAHKKSLRLLKDWLSDVEYNSLMEEGNLELPSQYEKDTIYIVNKDPTRRIGIKKRGKVVEKSLCIHASHAYADGDVLLANILLLKTDEKKFLEIANVHDFYA